MANSAVFPLSCDNLLQVLGKMSFKAATQMRRTCSEVDKMVTASRRLSFAAPEDVDCSVVIFARNLGELGYQLILKRNHYRRPLPVSPRCLESIHFEKITVSFCQMKSTECYSNLTELGFIESLREAKIKYRSLNHRILGHIEGVDPNLLTFRYEPTVLRHPLYPILPLARVKLPFTTLSQLPAAGCKYVEIGHCERFPQDYAPVFLQYKCVEIRFVSDPAPLVPLIQALLFGPTPTLQYFKINLSSREPFLTKEEIDRLNIEKWRACRPHTHTVIIRRFPKKLIEDIVSCWVNEILPRWIPFDASGFHRHLVMYLDNHYQAITVYTKMVMVNNQFYRYGNTELIKRADIRNFHRDDTDQAVARAGSLLERKCNRYFGRMTQLH